MSIELVPTYSRRQAAPLLPLRRGAGQERTAASDGRPALIEHLPGAKAAEFTELAQEAQAVDLTR